LVFTADLLNVQH